MSKRKYTVNEKYFNIINSHEKAYWLGFLTADAHLFTGGSTRNKVIAGIQLELATKDENHIKQFLDDIGSNAPIKATYHGKYEERRVRICSTCIAKTLIEKFKFSQNKSNSITFPDIDNIYVSSYILGYFDGDGSITIEKGNKPRLQILGNYNYLKSITNILGGISGVNTATIHQSSGICRILYGGKNQVKKIFNYLYQYDCPYLNRKYEKFLTI